jgi:hypothetical protein
MLAASSLLLSPHLYVYDLALLTPVLLVVAGSLISGGGSFRERGLTWSGYALLYATYSGAIAAHSRVQLSTVALVIFLFAIHRLWLSDDAAASA